jgi:hypothetical protein
MRKPEPVDEFAETQVLRAEERLTDRDADALSLYSEYADDLAREPAPRHDTRTRR